MRTQKSTHFIKQPFSLVLCFLCLGLNVDVHAAEQTLTVCNGKQVVGGSEKIVLDKSLTLDAKLDTGAMMSSLSATHVHMVKRHNKTWVLFSVYSPLKKTEMTFIKPFIKYVSILKREEETQNDANTQEQFAKRIVVPFDLCMGKQKLMIEVNLANRQHFRYPFLIGQSALQKFHVLVDVSQRNVTNPRCEES